MQDKTKGAWLIHHTNKLSDVKNVGDFEDINISGKCGLLVSHISEGEKQSIISKEKLAIIAKVAGISKLELPGILDVLSNEKIINVGKNGDVASLGITTTNVLVQTSNIFDSLNPSKEQKAAIELSEMVSDKPIQLKDLTDYIGDTYKIDSKKTADLISNAEEIGFIDSEEIDATNKLFFNGNLFRKDQLNKTNAVLSTLKGEESKKVIEFDSMLTKAGCISLEVGIRVLGKDLIEKLQSIGMYDFNKVANDQEQVTFITRPSAFAKFGNPFEEDALDLAKAFVSSLTYGMSYSSTNRGKITMLRALLNKLISGYEVGPATAIGQDYKILELKRVIAIRHDVGSKFYMKLLKKEVGVLALEVLNSGDASEQTVLSLKSGNVTSYIGPETNRDFTRKRQNHESKRDIIDALRTLR